MAPEPSFLQSLHDLLYEQGVNLKFAGIVLGLALLAGHLAALRKEGAVKDWLVKLPRNRTVGMVLLIIGTAWSLYLITFMDLGEFYPVKRWGQILLPVGCYLVITLVDEFLAVRAAGVLLMLMAGPVLSAAYLQEPVTRLLLPLLAYVWIFVGMFWVGMPYLMRDWIDWLVKPGTNRFKRACQLGAGYGALMLVCALLFY